MASRLNLLFQAAPRQYLERTVLFTHELTRPDALAAMRHRLTHHIDLQPMGTRSSAQVLAALHLYTDTPLTSYFAVPGTSVLIPRNDSPFRFVFLPEFSRCRLLLRAEGDDWLKLQVEEGLAGRMPPAEAQKDSPYLDSFAYWDHTTGHLVGRIGATAVLVKEPNQPWTVFMQQIAGNPGQEVVGNLFSRPLRY
jgi:hypothetical protein